MAARPPKVRLSAGFFMFLDRATIKLSAGKGGDGVVAWRREKYIPKGGPTGGNGGAGGSVIFEADNQLFCLQDYRYRKMIKADNGGQGGSSQKQGRQGKDLILKVPCGTIIRDPETEEVLCDLVEHKQRWTACKGGKGGLGNEFFKSPTHQAPNKCTPGKLGEERTVALELKLIADIGLIGYPNAGKSTLISSIANVPVKIAAYPFTTLHPNLGMIQFEDYSRKIIADIPGIIEGAHMNKGLGHEFLRHIERTKMLVFVLDASGIDGRTPAEDYAVLRSELEKYDSKLLNLPYLVVLNKADTPESELFIPEFVEKYPKETVYQISALEKEGIAHVKEAIYQKLAS